MYVRRRPNGETFISIRSSSGRNIGIFLMFMGLVGALPMHYIISYLMRPSGFYGVTDWRPGFFAAGVLLAIGFLFAVNTHKRIWVRDRSVRVKDGIFNRTLNFTWADGVSVKLRSIDEQRGHRDLEIWQVKLVVGDYEYLVDARPHQQLLSRRLAETLAKAIGCNLIEREGNVDIEIAFPDLDIPFRQRARKYPQVVGRPIAQPEVVRMAYVRDQDTRMWRWGLRSTGLLLEILFVTLMALAVSFVNVIPGSPSVFQFAVENNNWYYYYAVLLLLAFALVVVPGYEGELRLGRDKDVQFRSLLWRIPIISQSMHMNEVEEVRMHEGVRGPVIQIISDRKIITFRLSDSRAARWMAYETGAFIAGLERESPAQTVQA